MAITGNWIATLVIYDLYRHVDTSTLIECARKLYKQSDNGFVGSNTTKHCENTHCTSPS